MTQIQEVTRTILVSEMSLFILSVFVLFLPLMISLISFTSVLLPPRAPLCLSLHLVWLHSSLFLCFFISLSWTLLVPVGFDCLLFWFWTLNIHKPVFFYIIKPLNCKKINELIKNKYINIFTKGQTLNILSFFFKKNDHILLSLMFYIVSQLFWNRGYIKLSK